MELKPLSLGCWPTVFVKTSNISPTTSRVLKNVKVQINSLLPISLNQYTLSHESWVYNKSQIQEQYKQENERRRKKVQILQQIWSKIKLKRSKSSKTFINREPKLFVQLVQKQQRKVYCRSLRVENRESKSPLLFQAKSPIKTETYFNYYNTNKNKKQNTKKSYEEQSTKSKRQKTMSNNKINQYFIKQKSQKCVDHENSRRSWVHKMGTILKSWFDQQKQHQKQIIDYADLKEHEMKRLYKIHEIQREKMNKKIEIIRDKTFSRNKI